jgi:hypothetical protein
MATTPSRAVVPGYGMGLVTYVTGDYGGNTFRGVDMEKAIEAFAQVPMGQKLYVRPTWRELQKNPGRLDPDPYWKTTLAIAKQYGKRVGFRVQMSDPDIEEPALPDFVLDKVPMVPLRGGEWKRGPRPRTFLEPRYDRPFFQDAFRELNALLAAELDGSPIVEYMDTFEYGFWGEGHTWPFTDHPFPDGETAERTFVRMLEVQLERVGNSELIDRTIRSHNWLRTDTIFVENEQIEALSNRPPWVAAVIEVGMSDGSPESLQLDEGVTYTDNVVAHVMDVGANYFSLWNWHAEKAGNVKATPRYPEDDRHHRAARGYRVRPSYVWHYGRRATGSWSASQTTASQACPACSGSGWRRRRDARVGGGLGPGYPLPGRSGRPSSRCRGDGLEGTQAQGGDRDQGVRYPVRWACHQALEEDGSWGCAPRAGIGRCP